MTLENEQHKKLGTLFENQTGETSIINYLNYVRDV